MPRAIEIFQRAVLAPQPGTEARLRCVTVAELRIGNVVDVRPVDDVWLAPQIPAVEVGMLGSNLRDGCVKTVHELAYFRIVRAVSRRRLRGNARPVLRDEQRIRIRRAYPVWRRIDINLDE